MTLSNLTPTQKYKATASFPLLLCGRANSGKSESLVRMSAEDKKRTFILNFDSKPLGEDHADFGSVFKAASSSEELKKMVEKLTDLEMKKHIEGLLNTSYFIDDPEAIDKIVFHILKAAMSPNIDRIVIDTMTELINFCDYWSKKHFSGREIWNEYGRAFEKILMACKEATIIGGKFTYVIAHIGSIDPIDKMNFIKQVVAVKGGIMKNQVETKFTTVVEAYIDEMDGKYKFRADNINTMDTTRTKVNDGAFEFERNSLDDLEQLLSGNKIVVDNKLVPKV